MSEHLAIEALRAYARQPSIMVRELFHVEPDAWQVQVLDEFPTNPRQAMACCKGPGKAQPADTVIPTPTGDRRFGDLRVGDQVFAGDGSVTIVTGVYERGELPVFRVAFDDGSSTLACAEHLWKVRGRTARRHDTWSVLSTQQIMDRGVREKNGRWSGRHFEIPRQGPAQYPTADLPLDPYCLGVWLGDGVRKTGRYATKPEPDIAAKLESLGFRLSPVAAGVSTIYGASTALREIEVFECYSHERFVPAMYKQADIWQRQALLCGLMDTDGCCDADGHMSFASTSRQLADDVVWLVRSLGGVGYVRDKVKSPWYTGKNVERVDGRPCYTAVLNLPFNPFTVPHRQVRWKDPQRGPSTIRYMTRKIDAITEAGTAICRCISVAHPDKLYLTNDFIVTHNTAVLAWLGWNFLLTRMHPKVAALSITGKNLKDNLWAEMAKWQAKSPILQHLFEWTSERITLKASPETWFMSAKSFQQSASTEELGQTLAGTWAENVLFLIDEAGGIPVPIVKTAEAVLQGKSVDAHVVLAGNTTSNTGALYEAVVTRRPLWRCYEVTADPDDPKRTPRISADYARDQIREYGRDDPFVMINILARFPSQGVNQMISADQIRDCMGRHLHRHAYDWAAKIIGVDVADMGDDKTVVWPRQGLAYIPPTVMRQMDPVFIAGKVGEIATQWGAHSIQVDAAGGWGRGPIAILRQEGYNVLDVLGNAKPFDPKFENKNAEMYWTACDALKSGASLPREGIDELVLELSARTYGYKGDKICLEPKPAFKARIGRSPDFADALAYTHAFPVNMPDRTGISQFDLGGNVGHSRSDYDPLARV